MMTDEGTGVPSEGSRSHGRGPVLAEVGGVPRTEGGQWGFSTVVVTAVGRRAGLGRVCRRSPGGPGQHRLRKGLERQAEGDRPVLLPRGGSRHTQDTREPLKKRLLGLGE